MKNDISVKPKLDALGALGNAVGFELQTAQGMTNTDGAITLWDYPSLGC